MTFLVFTYVEIKINTVFIIVINIRNFISMYFELRTFEEKFFAEKSNMY